MCCTPIAAQLQLATSRIVLTPARNSIKSMLCVIKSRGHRKVVELTGTLVGMRVKKQPGDYGCFLTNRKRSLGIISYRNGTGTMFMCFVWLTPDGKIALRPDFNRDLVRLCKQSGKTFNYNYAFAKKIEKRDLHLGSWSDDRKISCDVVVHITTQGHLVLKSYRRSG
jgi:hypothetical protein